MEQMKQIPSGSVDMILCDLPYGVTRNRWDEVLPFSEMWEQYRRIAKPSAAIVLFSDGMFQARLMLSNPSMWRYNLVWDKVLSSGFLNANRMPLRSHEEICVFYKRQPTYTPQKSPGKKNHSKGKMTGDFENRNYGRYGIVDNRDSLGELKHPTSIIRFQKPHPSTAFHPTQKPLDLCVWLIKSFTVPGDTVLDNCMGSGTTGVSCALSDRGFIGIETDEKYFSIAKSRIEDTYRMMYGSEWRSRYE